MYKDMFDKLPKDWQSDAETTMQDELEECGQWMWGDNYLVTIEEKITYTKRYGDGTEIEDYEYRHVDTYDITCESCEEALEIVKKIRLIQHPCKLSSVLSLQPGQGTINKPNY